MRQTTPSSGTADSPLTPDGFEVLDACHRQSLLALSRLADLMAGIEQRGGDPDAETRAAVGEIVEFFSTTVGQHHQDEEQHVFPKLLLGGDPEIVQTVRRLQQDHHWMDVDWMELSPMLSAVAAGGGYDPDALREGLEIFTGLLRDHIALEESCIYPQARKQMQSAELQEMGREMAQRHRAGRGTPPAL